MVKLTKIYTRSGDDGTTGLGTGKRVPKTDPRVVAYGSVDETNASLGPVLCALAGSEDPCEQRIATVVGAIQHDLFDVGGDLCMPIGPGEDSAMMLRITPEQTRWLETVIDEFNAQLEPLTSFVLPSGTPLASALHVSRTVCRRAERDTAHLLHIEPQKTSMETMRYLNRLSDLLF
ncbi:MAG: cob(I)yrinic acid a,c-diamide adenosyltransferase, partial [Phycisphaerales bacterium]|nr:cob(I)yrinic acid a,c-diamide adenosyltransferase [Phycisphaerales bacterium]